MAQEGVSICIFGLSGCEPSIYQNDDNIQVYTLGLDSSLTSSPMGSISKLQYLKALPFVKRIVKQIKPDIVHAHFATSYGLLGALAGFHPFVLSVWGADIFDFPKKSPLHRALVKFNLDRADKILSTSRVMAVETGRYTGRSVEVTPFGIDLEIFKPLPVESLFKPNDIVIGTVKALEPKYGVDDLIRAFKLVVERYPHLSLRLLIVGGGSQQTGLEALARELGIYDLTTFTGRIPYNRVPVFHNMMSIFVSLSVLDSESFGVAVIEASACEKPVVVSNVGGLPEVVRENVTGFIVPPRRPDLAAAAIGRLVEDEQLRIKLGGAGRQHVSRNYDWPDNVAQMLKIYHQVVSAH